MQIRPVFSRLPLLYTVHRSAPYPIPAKERCSLGPDGALRIDMGFFNSYEMLGINTRPEDRVSLQMTLTYSPVRVKDLQRRSQGTIDFLLGPILN